MKKATISAPLMILIAGAAMSAFAEESPHLPDLFLKPEAATQSIRPIPLALHSDGLQDFRLRLEKAIASHDGVAIQALYQTDQVSAAES